MMIRPGRVGSQRVGSAQVVQTSTCSAAVSALLTAIRRHRRPEALDFRVAQEAVGPHEDSQSAARSARLGSPQSVVPKGSGPIRCRPPIRIPATDTVGLWPWLC